ncbi:YdcH family protein [Pseudomonas citronellolis]|uniref:YdcH family protein n=1 Tax=Pseudomonas citronellolis TaxID=53408 RepID=UPI0023E387BD|nr:YdcH family protein [Pseudomonas citronellolis]MDF3936750.1 YdcH family protein [Pseudomonas citronellolis]
MPLEHHPLAREFPEEKAKLAKLIGENAHFTRLAGTYEELDRKIYDVEDGRQPLDDLTLNNLKLQRVALKDEIAELLQRSS